MDIRMDKGAICLTGIHLLLVSSYATISENHFMFCEIMILFTLTSTYEMFITVINNGKKIKKLINYSRLTGPNANTSNTNTGQPKEAPGESKVPEEAPGESKAPVDWINFEIKHGGTQDISEFMDGKSLRLVMSDSKTIKDLKYELSEKISFNPKPEHIILRTKTFGKILADATKLKDASQLLFITIRRW